MNLPGANSDVRSVLARAGVTVFAACLCLTAAGHSFPASVTISGAEGRRLDDYATRAEALGFSGTLFVEKGGRVILSKGYGYCDIARGIPNSPDTVFYLASLSKQFTAAAILKLESDGKLSVNDQISRYLPGVEADKAAITIHQLLTHTSGLGNFGFDDLAGDWRQMNRDDAVRGILGTQLQAQPGKKFSYTNTDYLLLAAIVEYVSKERFQDFVHQKLLVPGRVEGIGFGWNWSGDSLQVAHGYSGLDDLGNYLGRTKTWLRVGPADALARAEDLGRWLRALQSGGVLPANEREKMFSLETVIEPGYGYGYGWWVRQTPDGLRRIVFHAGDFPGYHSEMRWYSVDDLVLIVASNMEFRGSSITENLLNGTLAVLQGKEPDLQKASLASPEEAAQLAGKYVLEDGGWIEVTDKRARLFVSAQGQKALDLLMGNDTTLSSSRRDDGQRALDLVMRLKHQGSTAYGGTLTPGSAPQEKDFEEEWKDLSSRYGDLRSFQFIGTLPVGSKASRSILQMNFERKTLFMAFTWIASKLDSTQPNVNPLQSLALGRISKDHFIAFDWAAAKSLEFEFVPNEHGEVSGLRLTGHDVVSYLKREKP